MFGRVELNLGQETPSIPTDELISSYKSAANRELEVLIYQYGRYLLISSSRSGSLPANLQGVWNDSNDPAWRSDYHFNINIQMNYWPAFNSNLSECAVPLLDYIESLKEPGQKTAKEHYGIEDDVWTVNCANDPFGYTAPGDKMSYGWAPNSNAFICQQLWDHYTYTQDTELLKNRIYPIMRGAAEFWSKWLIEDEDGTLVSSPSYSPEQGPLAIGVAMDQQLAYDIFTNTAKAAEILGIDEDFKAEILDKRSNLSNPVMIGEYGQIEEWKQGSSLSSNNHRHLPARDRSYWDGTTTHNPYIIKTDGKYYLYYIGTTAPEGTEEAPSGYSATWWRYRNGQRIGVAVSDSPYGPWERFDKPVLDISTETNEDGSTKWDSMLVSNPAVAVGPDGKVVMLYKGVQDITNGNMENKNGDVKFGVATADDPLGPFTKQPDLIFTDPNESSHIAENPYVWYSTIDNKYKAITRDVQGLFTGNAGGLALFESVDGATDWKPSKYPAVLKNRFMWENGVQSFENLERPWLMFDERGIPIMLSGATGLSSNRATSTNVLIPLK